MQHASLGVSAVTLSIHNDKIVLGTVHCSTMLSTLSINRTVILTTEHPGRSCCELIFGLCEFTLAALVWLAALGFSRTELVSRSLLQVESSLCGFRRGVAGR